MTDETRVIVYAVWAVMSVLAWGKVLIDRVRSYNRWHDARARRELVENVGLFLVAFAACLSLVLLIFGQSVVGIRGIALAVALGSFLAVGIVKATLGARQMRQSKYGRRIGDG